MQTQKYGLMTSITMIIGIVIGSGIFFKSDNILVATNGSVALGVLLFVLAAISIIFGSLTIAQLARNTDATGGVIAYMEDAFGARFACAFGWFQIFLYYPALATVVSWVFGVYFCSFFLLPETLEMQVLVGIIALCILYTVNILAAKIGAYFQNAATLIKMIPLVAIALAGLFFQPESVATAIPTLPAPPLGHNVGWLAAIAPIAFSFDGWIISTSIAPEIKNARRNLPLALIIAPLVILVIYIAYFLGVTTLLSPELIMTLGDGHVNLAATGVFGATGAKLIIIFVMISVLGTVNGIVIGNIRLPYALALRQMVPASPWLRQINHQTTIPTSSAIFSLLTTMVWMLLHYLSQKYQWLPNSDVSEIAIVMSYLLYISLYLHVIRLYRQKEITSFWNGIITPFLAILGSLFIFYGGSQNPLFIYYALCCLLVMGVAVLYYGRKVAS